jgi:AbrB family looped-hinge helix DNA binding protein
MYLHGELMRRHEFYGSTTVGKRGQIVLSADLRRAFDLNPGDKLIILGEKRGDEPFGRIILVKAEMLNRILEHMERHQRELKEILNRSMNEPG